MQPSSLEALSEPDPRGAPPVHTQDQAVAPALDGAEPDPRGRSVRHGPGAEAAHDPPRAAPPIQTAGQPERCGGTEPELPAAAPADYPDLREPRRTGRNGGG